MIDILVNVGTKYLRSRAIILRRHFEIVLEYHYSSTSALSKIKDLRSFVFEARKSYSFEIDILNWSFRIKKIRLLLV